MSAPLPSDPAKQDPISPPRPSGRRHAVRQLPTPLTSFVGRESEIDAISATLRRNDVRLLTLTGSGGVGKTRLAVAVADKLAEAFDDVVFVDLAPVTDPELVLPTIGDALAVPNTGAEPLVEQLKASLANRQVLLVLDNVEQVTVAGPHVTNRQTVCPGLKVLATSRERLRVSGEREYSVPPLSIPPQDWRPSVDGLNQFKATQLFVDRASAHKHDYRPSDDDASAIAEICRGLDGLPLAIELAAGWSNVLTPAALLSQKPRLPLLTGGPRDAPARQRTMRDAIAWSYDRLAPAEQALFRNVAVCADGFTIEAAKAIAGLREGANLELLGLLRSLVDKSLLRLVTAPADEPRYAMLETIREFGLAQLADGGELSATRERHAGYYWQLTTDDGADGPDPQMDRARADELETELPNIGLALDWFLEQEDLEAAVTLLLSMSEFWMWRGGVGTARSWWDRVLAVSPALSPTVRGLALLEAKKLAILGGDEGEIKALSAEALQLLEAEVAQAEERFAGQDPDLAILRVLGWIGLRVLSEGWFDGDDLERAIRLCERFLAAGRRRSIDDPGTYVRFPLYALSRLVDQQGDSARADALLQEAAALGGHDFLWERALLARRQGDDRRALALYQQALPLRRANRADADVAGDLTNVADVMMDLGEHAAAAALLREALALAEEAKNLWIIALARSGLARVAECTNELHEAIAQWEVVLEIRQRLGERNGQAEALGALAYFQRGLGDYAQAMALHREQLAIGEELGSATEVAGALCSMGLTHLAHGHLDDAHDLCSQALAIWEEANDPEGCSEALCSLADVAREQGDVDGALSLYRQSIARHVTARRRWSLSVGGQHGIGRCILSLVNLEASDGDVGRAA